MTFFKTLMRVLAAVAASTAVIVISKIIAVLQGAPPSDVSPVIWGIVSTVGVFVLNLLLGKIPKPESAEPPSASRRSQPGNF